MDLRIEPGNYIVAVSGGVDSVVLLDLLACRKQVINKNYKGTRLRLTVAHFDHGIRQNSINDRLFVEQLARHYNLPFVYDQGNLGSTASEAVARQARYIFLHKVQLVSKAQAIITAHHQDDVLETVIINLLRGTGRKGLTSLDSSPPLLRPLLSFSKKDLFNYAQERELTWQEDLTNKNTKYLRNYVRHNLLSRFHTIHRQQLIEIIIRQKDINLEIDTMITNLLHNQTQAGTIDREWFNSLPHAVEREILAVWLRTRGIRDFDSKLLERLTISAKISAGGKRIDIVHGYSLQITKNILALRGQER